MKNSFMKKLLSSFLALTMVVTFAPANMGYAINESKQAELRAWQEKVKKATDAEEEKANAKLELAKVKADVTKFVTACLASMVGIITAGAGYVYHEKLQLPFYQEKQKLENEMKAKDQEHEREQLKIKQDDDYAKLNQKITVAAADAGLTGVGFVFGPIGKVIWTLYVQTQFALQGLFGENAENITRSQMEKLFNAAALGLGKTWNGTKYCAGSAKNATVMFFNDMVSKIWGKKNLTESSKRVITCTPSPEPTLISTLEVTQIPTPTSTPEWTPTPEITPESTPEVVQPTLEVTPTFTPAPTPEVTQTPTPTPTPEWTPTSEITPESTPEVVQSTQAEGEL